MNDINSFDYQAAAMEDSENSKAHNEAASDEFVSKMMNGLGPNLQQNSQQIMGNQAQGE